MLVSFYRIFKFAWQSFWRNIWLSIVTITIIVLTFISVNFLIILNFISDTTIETLKDKIDVSIYFFQNIPEPQVLEVKTYLSSLAQVKDITYISQQQALENFREKHKNEPEIIQSLEELEQNPLGATLIIKANDIKNYPEILEILENSKYNNLISDKNFEDNRLYIQKINQISWSISKIGIITILIFIFIAVLIVFNTIRVAIYTHREEIGIMKLVGATNWFIKAPFILESISYGIIACGISLLILYPILSLIQPYLNNFFLAEFNILRYFNQNFLKIFGLELLGIILLNVISSHIALSRYLRV